LLAHLAAGGVVGCADANRINTPHYQKKNQTTATPTEQRSNEREQPILSPKVQRVLELDTANSCLSVVCT
jgi:hypothetical protein